MVTVPRTPTGTGEKKGEKFILCEYIRELRKPFSQIAFRLKCIELKETFDYNCETASSAESKNLAKSIPSIIDTLDGFSNDFSLNYLNLTNSNNQEFTMNNETPIIKCRTTAESQESQAQIMIPGTN